MGVNSTTIAMELTARIPGKCHLQNQAEAESERKHSKQEQMNNWQRVAVGEPNLIRNTLNITCEVDGGKGRWNWTRFQEVTDSFAEAHNGFYIGLTIVCSGNGSITMERPHQARLLWSLSILGCFIHSYNVLNTAMLNRPQNDLNILTLENCVLVIRLSELMKEIKKHHEPDCLINPSLVYYRQHNLSAIPEWDIRITMNDSVALEQHKEKTCRCPALKHLELSGHNPNNFSYIDSFFPAPRSPPLYPNLKVLILTRNNLMTAPYHLYTDKWWAQFGALEKIDLSHNRITSLSFRKKQPVMTSPWLTVDLSNNSIESITLGEVKGLDEFWPNSLSLANNPFVCNCSLNDVVTFLKNRMRTSQPRRYINEILGNSIECVNPTNMIGIKLLDLTKYSACDNESGPSMDLDKYITMICGVVTGLALLIVLVLWYRRCKTQSAVTVSYQSTSESDDDKTYDAFISYSSLDETWVMGELYSFLESHAFHVCLHHKDFIPGACISENIINSIDKSRHTILVLSPNFLGSEWCLLEFRKAFQQSLVEKTGHLIVVVKESVDLVSLEKDMRHFIETHTYLSLGDSRFWDKLNRSLT
ncbi:Protein toll [Mizuhopecten yessoensis]|uniref:Protein toll n=2 Tax=Mizuhopecten yessoensis TaxID=6573 RepID=A0A210QLW1_MIZYE|nr:Protein toll [Mizuhopecten yessoensis]